MNNKKMAKSFLEQAEVRLLTARKALQDKNYPFCVRNSQECVELTLKAVLRFVGIEPPKWHDVGIILIKNRGKLPAWFSKRAEEFATISRWLAKEREPSTYGDEELGIPPSEIYTSNDALKALREAEKVFKFSSRLVKS